MSHSSKWSSFVIFKKLSKPRVPLINEIEFYAVLITFLNVVFIVFMFRATFADFSELFGQSTRGKKSRSFITNQSI